MFEKPIACVINTVIKGKPVAFAMSDARGTITTGRPGEVVNGLTTVFRKTRETKFRKSRYVPLSASTVAELRK